MRRSTHMSTDIDNPTSPTKPVPIATLDGVTRRYGQVTAVDRLTLQIQRGQTVALLGPNGAGKTTAVELLLGLATPDAGVVRLFGAPPADAVAAGRVGAMLQDAGLPQGAKVAELIGLVRGLYPEPLSLADALRLTDLEEVAGRQTHRLEEADTVADRVVVISGGRLLADGTPQQVKTRAAGRSTVSVAADGLPAGVVDGLPAVAAVE